MAKKEKKPIELYSMRHSCEHVMTQAMLELYPGLKMAMGPATDEGFYFDFDYDDKITEEDFPKIEKAMKRIVKAHLPFTNEKMSVKEARSLFETDDRLKGNEYKNEWLDLIDERGEEASIYRTGDEFTDLCAGPHVEHTGQIGPYKLLSLAGAYWHGDEKNKMLTRIYGTCFHTREELDEYLERLKEAKRRDHKKLGKDLDLFAFSPTVGNGLPMMLPKGETIKHELSKFIREVKEARGYQFVSIPHIAKSALYERSGHLGKYDAMMPLMEDQYGDTFAIKAMNCPHHFELYNARKHSYRELPLRIAENTTCYRNEKSGELAGLVRVKNLTQDDTHHFVRHDQIQGEIEMIIGLLEKVFGTFGFADYQVQVSIRDPKTPEKYFGDDTLWSNSEKILVEAVKQWGMPYVVEEGEAAFYGPKIDIMVKDAIGRMWQLTTVQLDFSQPENFDMTYTGKDGEQHRPAVLHVAIYGSLERFMGILIEHYAGAFPTWLAPVQLTLIPVAAPHEAYATELLHAFTAVGVRAELMPADDSLSKRIRNAELQKVPYMAVIGDKEIESKKLNIRDYKTKKQSDVAVSSFVKRIQKEIAERTA